MKEIIITVLLLTCAALLVGCKDGSEPPKQTPDTEPNTSEPNVPEPNVPDPNEPAPAESPGTSSPGTFEIQGTIAYKNIEGGFFAIDGNDGRKYDPINLPESFRKDGLKVKVTARLRRDAVSFHMYGAIIDVVSIAAQ